jgi:hypothetical protein
MSTDVGQFAEAHYTAARDELLMRIRLRDNALLVFLAFSGAIFSVALSKQVASGNGSADPWLITIVIPFVSLGCGIIVAQHNAVIGALIRYIANDLKSFLRTQGCIVPEFGSSLTFKDHSLFSNRMRTGGHLVILSVPAIVALAANWEGGFYSSFPLGEVWWLGVLSYLGLLFLTWYVHERRKNVYDTTEWHKNES